MADVPEEVPTPPVVAPPPTSASVRGTFHLQATSQFMSPLPPGDELQVYEQFAPGATARMLALQERFQDQAEQEQEHRHGVEVADSRRRDIGQVFAIVFSSVVFVAALALAFTGREQVAGVFFGATMVAILVIVGLGRLPWPNRSDTEEW